MHSNTNPRHEPSSALSAEERRIIARHQQFGVPDVYVSGSETCAHPFVDDVDVIPLRFDVRNSLFVNILWAKKAGGLGRHRHRGPVSAYTLEGTWGYREYDWVARPGDFVEENPGVIHTLYTDTGCKTLFFVQGALEFYDDQDCLLRTLDVFAMLDMYVCHCEAKGLRVNERLIF